jgi:hypothetical protein
MFKRQVTYTYDGDTFVGSYLTTSFAGVQSVAVQLADKTISARIGDLSEEKVARILLGELVRERFDGDAIRPGLGRQIKAPVRDRTN